MPTINESQNADLSGYGPAEPAKAVTPAPPMDDANTGMMRCPLPALLQTGPDNLKQFDLKGKVPQRRLLSQAPSVNGGSTGSSKAGGGGVVIEGGSSSGQGVVTPPDIIAATQSVVITPTLAPNASYTGSVVMAETFQLVNITSGVAVRFRLYGTALAQTADLTRALDMPPPAGTGQNIISDVVIDTLPYEWTFQDRTGVNGDTPASSTIYVTVTNLSSATVPVTVVIGFVPLAGGFRSNSTGGSNGSATSSSNINFANVAMQNSSVNFAYVSTAAMNVVASGGLTVSGNQVAVQNSNVTFDNITGSAVDVSSASALTISGVQISSADLSNNSQIVLENSSPTFTNVTGNVFNAASSAGIRVAGAQIQLSDLSNNSIVVTENSSPTFTSCTSPIVNISSATGLSIGGSSVDTGSGGGANIVTVNNTSTQTFAGNIDCPILNLSILNQGGAQATSSLLANNSDLPKLSAVSNTYTGSISASTISTSGASISLFGGPISSSQFVQAAGSTASNVFLGTVTSPQFTQAAGSTATNSFLGPISAVSMALSGGVSSTLFSGDVAAVDINITGGLNTVLINSLLPPAEGSSDKTLNHAVTTTASNFVSLGLTASNTAAVTGMSWTVTAASTADIFNINAAISFLPSSTGYLNLAMVALVDGVFASQFGYGMAAGQGVASEPFGSVFTASVSGLAAGSHTIAIYYTNNATPTVVPTTPISRTYGQLQQIS
jgi:hypothetical protein